MQEFSLAEENYIKAIYHLSDAGAQQASTNAIAEKLATKPASVSDMIRKLSAKGVISYVKYQGVNITEEGKKVALKVIRKHRLWEVFLVNKLNFHWDEVHEIAEQLEHVHSSLLITRLDEFLGYPKFDPHGDPIPNAEGELSSQPMKILSDLPKGKTSELVALKDSGSAFLNYLDRQNITIGSHIRVMDQIEFDGSVEITINDGPVLTISKQAADNLMVVVE